jgi:hypothetical protein
MIAAAQWQCGNFQAKGLIHFIFQHIRHTARHGQPTSPEATVMPPKKKQLQKKHFPQQKKK